MDMALTVEDLKKLANKATGLIAMRTLRNFAPYRINEIHGFSPREAFHHLQNRDCALLDDALQARAELLPRQQSVIVTTTVAPRADGSSAAVKPEIVEIPDDWEQQQVLKTIALAKRIMGDKYVVPENQKPGEYAHGVVKAEVDRRAATAAAPAGTESVPPQA